VFGPMRMGAIFGLALVATGVGACGPHPLQASDGGAAGSGGGGGSGSASSNPAPCTVVLASDYDQSCMVDADCVSVHQVPKCPVTDCSGCYPVAINKSAMERYTAALSQAVASAPPGPLCYCPCESGLALCRGGTCQAASCGPPVADTLPACSNAGGACGYAANTICNRKGPPDACAYSDELCCLD